MRIQDTLSLASSTLEHEGIGFALIGGLALAAHGIVRATDDIDLLCDGKQSDRLERALTQVGFKTVHRSDEVIQFSGKGQLDVLLANRPATQSMLRNAKKINGFPVPVVCAEDIIGLKIQAYKNDPIREFQDKADIQNLILNKPDLNYIKVREYADLFDEWGFIESLRAKK